VKLWLILKHTSWKNHTFSLSTQLIFFKFNHVRFFNFNQFCFLI
jgi:hypothetical protein